MFAFPPPTPEQVRGHWRTINYNRSADADELFAARHAVIHRALRELGDRSPEGPLLDVGSNFGHFLDTAREYGWQGQGFEPYEEGAAAALSKGFETTVGWQLEEAGFEADSFNAVTAFDSFCYVWHPFATLAAMYELLKPGGTVAMRVSNKRFVIRLAFLMTRAGSRRDELVSRLLQNQFHTIAAEDLRQVMRSLGYRSVSIIRGASTAPWQDLPAKTRVAYVLSELASLASFGRANFSPGILIVASKPV